MTLPLHRTLRESARGVVGPVMAASTRPVFAKLGLKPERRAAALRVPVALARILGKPPAGTKLESVFRGKFDFILGFYDSKKALSGDLAKIRRALTPTGTAWVCWRKGGVTDLSREAVWALGEASGLDSVGTCAIDDDWSAMKLMFPKSRRG